MSQSNNSTTNWCDDDDYEFGLDGIDWSAIGRIEGDEPESKVIAGAKTQPSTSSDPPPPTEIPPRAGSSPSSYGFADIETLDEDDVAKLEETERLYALETGERTCPARHLYAHRIRRVEEIPENVPSSSARTLDTKRKLPGKDTGSSALKKPETLPSECTRPSSKGKETARNIPMEQAIQKIHDSFMISCTCPMYVIHRLVYSATTPLRTSLKM